MTAASTPLLPARAASAPPSLAELILKADIVYLYFVLFTASGAVFRYGAINTWLWYVLYGWTLARLSLDLPDVMRAALRSWPVFLWPALALASIVWSLAPGATLRGGLQLLMTTLIAVFIGSRFTLRQILTALTILIFISALVSFVLLFIGMPDLFAEVGGFQGIYAHKNTFGLRMNILITAALILFFTTRWKIPLAGVLAVAVYGLILSKSATSQILALLTPGALFGLAVLKLDANRAALGLAAGAALCAAGAVALFAVNGDPVSYILDSFGKDETLTGRTWLWEQAREQIDKHPLIGGGYQAFWGAEHSSDVVWIRHITLDTVKGFHNVGLEVWNDLGVPGLAALIGVVLAYAWRAFRFYRMAPTADGLFPIFFLAILVVSASVNNSFFRQHELVHVMICAFYAATALPCLRAPAYHPERRL